MTYPDPEFPIGYTVPNRLDELFTVVEQTRADRIMAREGARLFSDQDAQRIRWFYTLRTSAGREHSTSESGLRHMEYCAAERAREGDRAIQVERSKISPTQPGRMLSVGERLRSPHGTWTVTRARRLYEKSERGMGEQYCTYLLTLEDGHPEEWRARDMADADFHLVLDEKQQALI